MKRILTFQKGKTPSGNQWVKTIRGKRHYFGPARSKSNKEDYLAAEQRYLKLLETLEPVYILQRPNCKYPNKTASSAYNEGCRCNECKIAYSVRIKSPENVLKRNNRRREKYKKNSRKVLEINRKWREKNQKKVSEIYRRSRRRRKMENPVKWYIREMINRIQRDYPIIANEILVELSPNEEKQIENLVEEMYTRQKELTRNCSKCGGSGKSKNGKDFCRECKLTLDHNKPLSVGGLHHPDNLQIMTLKENLRKGKYWDGVSGC